MANTFHGVPDRASLAQAARDVLCRVGLFGIVNWHALSREQTMVLDLPRGPRADMRLEPQTIAAIIEPEGFQQVVLVELPPYHYGVVFERSD